jgi:orotate phosphoribosyltransferase
VFIVDDVMTAGTAVRESVAIIRAAGAIPAAVAISLDRMERGSGELSAVEEVQQLYGMPVVPIARLDDLLGYLQNIPDFRQNVADIMKYRELYGIRNHD